MRATAAAIIGYDPVVTPKVAFAVRLPLHAALLAADLGPLVNLEEGGGASQEAICEGVLANVVWSPALKDDEMKVTEFDIVPVPPPPGDHEGDEGPPQGGFPFVAILVDLLISVDYFKLTITHDKGEGKEVFARLCNRVREAVNAFISRSVWAKERMFKAWPEALQAAYLPAYLPQVLPERSVLPFVATLTEPPEKHRALYYALCADDTLEEKGTPKPKWYFKRETPEEQKKAYFECYERESERMKEWTKQEDERMGEWTKQEDERIKQENERIRHEQELEKLKRQTPAGRAQTKKEEQEARMKEYVERKKAAAAAKQEEDRVKAEDLEAQTAAAAAAMRELEEEEARLVGAVAGKAGKARKADQAKGAAAKAPTADASGPCREVIVLERDYEGVFVRRPYSYVKPVVEGADEVAVEIQFAGCSECGLADMLVSVTPYELSVTTSALDFEPRGSAIEPNTPLPFRYWAVVPLPAAVTTSVAGIRTAWHRDTCFLTVFIKLATTVLPEPVPPPPLSPSTFVNSGTPPYFRSWSAKHWCIMVIYVPSVDESSVSLEWHGVEEREGGVQTAGGVTISFCSTANRREVDWGRQRGSCSDAKYIYSMRLALARRVRTGLPSATTGTRVWVVDINLAFMLEGADETCRWPKVTAVPPPVRVVTAKGLALPERGPEYYE